MKGKSLVVIVLAVAIALIGASAAMAAVVGSAHDMRSYITDAVSTQVCVYCHTPHQATAITQDPLWNHTATSTAAFGVYASSTLDATVTDIGAGTSVSLLCMGCHDGTVAINSVYKAPTDGNLGTVFDTAGGIVDASGLIVSGANLGIVLSNDHPINFTYDAALVTADGGLNDPTTLPNAVLFGGTVQCGTCHDVHDDTNVPFLRTSNAASALCTECHTK
ncbi:MAG TPA: cytochrome C [Nitrospiraceae bacterium]|nr:cytochrome C [Nitrospiraceae bacterium]